MRRGGEGLSIFQNKKRQKKKETSGALLQSVPRAQRCPELGRPEEAELYRQLRTAVPIIDAALSKIVRLTGDFHLVVRSAEAQRRLDHFVETVPVGVTGVSLQSFADMYLDSLLTYGNALAEMRIDTGTGAFLGLQCAPPDWVDVVDEGALSRGYYLKDTQGRRVQRIPYPERILFTALAPPPGEVYGVSVLRGLPALSEILLQIYSCIGQNYERMGNVRYAVTYKPASEAERAYAGDRVQQIADAWQTGMRAGAYGEVRDFICAGDVEIQAIGADNALLDTEVPVRQLLEQLIAKLSIPPFLLGLNWSSTERMSSQQADILTSELEYYRRLLAPALRQVGEMYLQLEGFEEDVTVAWSNINLQDETELAQARLWNAQAAQLEAELDTVSGK